MTAKLRKDILLLNFSSLFCVTSVEECHRLGFSPVIITADYVIVACRVLNSWAAHVLEAVLVSVVPLTGR